MGQTFNWKRLLITVVIVTITAGAVGGTTWYVMDAQSKKDKTETDRQIAALEKQMGELKTPTKAATNTNTAASTTTTTSTKSTFPSLGQLKSGYYSIDSKSFKMTNGSYNSGSDTYTLEEANLANSQNAETAVIVKKTSGGTGVFRYLVIMGLKGDSAQHISDKLMGDRVIINSLTYMGDTISVTMTTHGPSDPSCCPTLNATKRFRLTSDSKLIEL